MLTSQDLGGPVRKQQQHISIVVPFAAQERHRHQTGDQHQRKAQRVEELRGNEEAGQQVVVDDVVLLLEHPHAAGESGVVESMDVLEVVQTHRPQSWNIINRYSINYGFQIFTCSTIMKHSILLIERTIKLYT